MNARLPHDAALPHLDTAWNAGAMRGVLESALRTVDGTPVRIARCRIERFRYRAAARAIVLYELDLARDDSPATAEHRNGIWVTGVMYADGRARSVYQKTNKLAGKFDAGASGGLVPTAFIEDLDMFVQVFPVDRYLPAVGELATALPPDLEAAMLASFGPGTWTAVNAEVRPVRYRPFQGMTLRYDLEAQEADSRQRSTRRFFAKTYRDESGSRTHELLSDLASRWSSANGQPAPPRSVGYFERHKTLVVAAAEGASVDVMLKAGADPHRVGLRCARALLDLHACEVPARDPFGPADMLERAVSATEFLVWALPSAAAPARRVLDAIAAAPAPVLLRTCHLDLKPDHLFVDGDAVTFIDLDTLGPADPAVDIAALYARLQALEPTCAGARTAAESFLNAYLDGASPQVRHGFPLAYAYTLLQLALFALRHQEPEWPAAVRGLVERAASAIFAPEGAARELPGDPS